MRTLFFLFQISSLLHAQDVAEYLSLTLDQIKTLNVVNQEYYDWQVTQHPRVEQVEREIIELNNALEGDAIAIFDASGKFVKRWGSDMRGGAHGLTIRMEGGQEFLNHCDNARGFVRKTTLDGEVVWVIQAPVTSGLYRKASEYRPSNLAIAPQ